MYAFFFCSPGSFDLHILEAKIYLLIRIKVMFFFSFVVSFRILNKMAQRDEKQVIYFHKISSVTTKVETKFHIAIFTVM